MKDFKRVDEINDIVELAHRNRHVRDKLSATVVKITKRENQRVNATVGKRFLHIYPFPFPSLFSNEKPGKQLKLIISKNECRRKKKHEKKVERNDHKTLKVFARGEMKKILSVCDSHSKTPRVPVEIFNRIFPSPTS